MQAGTSFRMFLEFAERSDRLCTCPLPPITTFGTAYANSRDHRAAPDPGGNRAARHHMVRLRQRGEQTCLAPRAGNPLGVPELHNIWVASAETAPANSIRSPNDAE